MATTKTKISKCALGATDKTDKRSVSARVDGLSAPAPADRTDKRVTARPRRAQPVDTTDSDKTPRGAIAGGGSVNATERIRLQPVSSVTWVPRDSLIPNDYNPNHVPPLELKLLKRSILAQGWTQPIVVLKDGKTIVDGFHRWTVSGDKQIAAMTGGLVPIVIIDADETQRVAATIRHNRARGEHGITPMCSIVRGFLDGGLTIEEIMAELGMQREEVLRLADQRGRPEAVGGGKEFSGGWQPG